MNLMNIELPAHRFDPAYSAPLVTEDELEAALASDYRDKIMADPALIAEAISEYLCICNKDRTVALGRAARDATRGRGDAMGTWTYGAVRWYANHLAVEDRERMQRECGADAA